MHACKRKKLTLNEIHKIGKKYWILIIQNLDQTDYRDLDPPLNPRFPNGFELPSGSHKFIVEDLTLRDP